jgi:hypothetical protein
MSTDEKWELDAEESEYNDDDTIRIPDIDTEFRNNVLKVKHSLYDNTVLAPELGTADAQSHKVLNTYLDKLNRVYILSLNAQKGIKIKQESLTAFPAEIRDLIQWVLRWIHTFFAKNTVAKTIPYEDYIRTTLHDYPFVQN